MDENENKILPIEEMEYGDYEIAVDDVSGTEYAQLSFENRETGKSFVVHAYDNQTTHRAWDKSPQCRKTA